MADKKKKNDDVEHYLAAVFGSIVLLLLGAVLVVANVQKIIPKKHYIESLVREADSDIKILRDLDYTLLLNSLKSTRDSLLKDYAKMQKTAEQMTLFRKAHHVNGVGIIKFLLSSKKNPYKTYTNTFLHTYIDYLELRAKLLFYCLMTDVVEFEYLTIAVVVILIVAPFFVFLFGTVKKTMDDRNILALVVSLFESAKADDLGFVNKNHPFANKFLINVDGLRDYVRKGLNGGLKMPKVAESYRENKDLWKYIYAIGTTIVFMKNAVEIRDGKYRKAKEGYPASTSSRHNPDRQYGLLVHSLGVAYLATHLAFLNGETDTLKLLKVFYAGIVHDAGKIRLMRKKIGSIEIVDAPDAIEGDKHIKEAKKKAKENKVKWENLQSINADQTTQMKIFISKTSKVFPDSEILETYVKEADHWCVDSELRYTAMSKKERKEFFTKAIREFFKSKDENRRFNSFDSDMVGVVFEVGGKKKLFLLATFATRLRRFIEETYSKKVKDLKFLLPMVSKGSAGILPSDAVKEGVGNLLRPFSYSVSHFLHENGLLRVFKDPRADIVGLYDIVVQRENGQEIGYNACWLIDDFNAFCEWFNLQPDVVENAKVIDIIQRIKEDTINSFEMKKAEFEKGKTGSEGEVDIEEAVSQLQPDLQSSVSRVVVELKSGGSEVEADLQSTTTDYKQTTTDYKPSEHSEQKTEERGLSETGGDAGAVRTVQSGMMGKMDNVSASGVSVNLGDLNAVVDIERTDEEQESREEKVKKELSRIKLVFRELGVKLSEDKYRVRKYFGKGKSGQEGYRKLKEDTYALHGGVCAVCGKEVAKRNMRVIERYRLDEENKRIVLEGMDLVCDSCYIVITADGEKIKSDSGYKRNIYLAAKNGVGLSETTEDELADYIIKERERLNQIQEEYKKLSLTWLREKGYIQKND